MLPDELVQIIYEYKHAICMGDIVRIIKSCYYRHTTRDNKNVMEIWLKDNCKCEVPSCVQVEKFQDNGWKRRVRCLGCYSRMKKRVYSDPQPSL